MEQPHLAGPHCVLPTAEVGQALADEALQRLQGLLAGDRPGKRIQRAWVRGKSLGHQLQHAARGLIRFKPGGRRYGRRPLFAEGLAVVGIEVPLAAHRLLAIHQHLVAHPQFAVPVLQAQLLAALGMRGKVPHGAEEVPVFADVQRQLAIGGHRLDRLQNAPVARCGHHQALGLQARNGRAQLGAQAAQIAGVVQVPVVHPPARAAQGLRMVAHRRQEQRDAGLGRPHMRGLFGHFGHPHRVVLRIGAVEARRLKVELVAQHHQQVAQPAHRAAARRSRAPWARQASLHTFTSSQFLAQALRHTMGRPHTVQGLLGNCALLPRNPLARSVALWSCRLMPAC